MELITDYSTYQQAVDATKPEGERVTKSMLDAWLADPTINSTVTFYREVELIIATDGHPFQNALASFMNAVSWDFRKHTELGFKQYGLLEALSLAETPLKPIMIKLKPLIDSVANKTVPRFPNINRNQYAIATDDQGRFKQIPDSQITDDYLVIDVDADVAGFEAHAPQVYVIKAGKKRRIAGFTKISESGTYDCFVNKNRSLFIDDVYNSVA